MRNVNAVSIGVKFYGGYKSVVSISETSGLIGDTAVKVSVSVLRRFGSALGLLCSACV